MFGRLAAAPALYEFMEREKTPESSRRLALATLGAAGCHRADETIDGWIRKL